MRALIDLGGYSVEERLRALEEYARKSTTEKGREEIEQIPGNVSPNSHPLQVSKTLWLGSILVQSNTDDDLAQKVLNVASQLDHDAGTHDVAEAMEEIVIYWGTPAMAAAIQARLASGRISAKWLSTVLDGRKRHPKHEVISVPLKGAGGAIGTLLAGDRSSMDTLLTGAEPRTAALLCACARLTRTALSCDAVAKLLDSHDPLVARAAELYLEMDDGPEARRLILARQPQPIRIFGAPYVCYSDKIESDPRENRLREQLKDPQGPEEVWALLGSSTWGDPDQWVISRQGGKAWLTGYQRQGRILKRALAPAEFEGLMKFLSEQQIEDLPPFDQGVMDGVQYEFVHATRSGGRRVCMNNPPGSISGGAFFPGVSADDPNPSIYGLLVRHFFELTDDRAAFQAEYPSAKAIPGFKFLLRREKAFAKDVMAQRQGLLVEVRHPGGWDTSWRSWNGAQLGGEAADPFPQLSAAKEALTEPISTRAHFSGSPWKCVFGHSVVQAVEFWQDHAEGLWSTDLEAPHKSQLLLAGSFGEPLVTPDGRWLVAAKRLGDSWAEPHTVICVRMSDQVAFPIALLPANRFNVVAWMESAKRVLLWRSNASQAPGSAPADGSDASAYYLLDPATGQTTEVKGDFRPLEQKLDRPLQPAAATNQVWAALPDFKTHGTEVGQYDLQKFQFHPWLRIPDWEFQSSHIWVDEERRVIYIALEGDLLSVDLPATGKE